MPATEELKRLRVAIDADRTGTGLETIVATLRKAKFDVGAHDTVKTAPHRWTPRTTRASRSSSSRAS